MTEVEFMYAKFQSVKVHLAVRKGCHEVRDLQEAGPVVQVIVCALPKVHCIDVLQGIFNGLGLDLIGFTNEAMHTQSSSEFLNEQL